MATAIQRLAARLVEMTDDRARRAHIERFKVRRVAPLLVEQIGGSDLVLEDGDPDFDISDTVAHAALHIGDVVLVLQTADEDWIAIEAIGASVAGGGGGGTTTSGVPVFVQDTEPTDPPPWVWYEVDGTGTLVTVWVST